MSNAEICYEVDPASINHFILQSVDSRGRWRDHGDLIFLDENEARKAAQMLALTKQARVRVLRFRAV